MTGLVESERRRPLRLMRWHAVYARDAAPSFPSRLRPSVTQQRSLARSLDTADFPIRKRKYWRARYE